MSKFTVQSGNIYYDDDGCSQTDYKYIKDFTTFEDALREWLVNDYYMVNWLFFTDDQGVKWDVAPIKVSK